MPGRHASPAGPSFYRDLLTMLGGILAVAALVYLGLTALSNSGEETPTTADVTTTRPDATSTAVTSPPTTSLPTTTRPATMSTSTSTTTAVLPPAEVIVQVLNSVGIQGLGARVTAELGDLGYQTLIPANYPERLSQSRVWYVPGFEAEAAVLADEFPDALVEQASSNLVTDADIVVVLGESFEG